MKSLYTTVILFLLGHSFAQNDSTQRVRLSNGGISFNYTLKQKELTLSPYVSLTYKKHTTQLGPLVTVLQEKESNISANGFQFRYAYNAYPLRKNIDLYIQSTVVYQLSKEKGRGDYFDLITTSFKSYSFSRSNKEFEIYGGYNIVWSVSNKLNIQQSTAYGLIKNTQKSKTDFNTQKLNQNLGSLNIGIGLAYMF